MQAVLVYSYIQWYMHRSITIALPNAFAVGNGLKESVKVTVMPRNIAN